MSICPPFFSLFGAQSTHTHPAYTAAFYSGEGTVATVTMLRRLLSLSLHLYQLSLPLLLLILKNPKNPQFLKRALEISSNSNLADRRLLLCLSAGRSAPRRSHRHDFLHLPEVSASSNHPDAAASLLSHSAAHRTGMSLGCRCYSPQPTTGIRSRRRGPLRTFFG